jgi:cell wall-associated NlpC family hydrolase
MILLSRDSSLPSTPYLALQDLSNTQSIELYFSDHGQRRAIELPPDIKKNLAVYLRAEKSLNPEEDCASFVHRLKGQPYEVGTTSGDRWQFIQITDESSLLPGDAIAFCSVLSKKRVSLPHEAIYLGYGLYISKAGARGARLVITGMAQMIALWPTMFVLKMTPKARETAPESISIQPLPLHFQKTDYLKIVEII